MTQHTTIVGIDIAKQTVDAAIRSVASASFENTAEGKRKLLCWLRRYQGDTAVMEASGGYESGWASLLRDHGMVARIVDPKRVRHFARSAGRLAKNDPIDAEMIAWLAETFDEAPGQVHDAAREELAQIVNARLGLLDLQTKLQKDRK